MANKYTVFIELSSEDDPPWELYRWVTAKTPKQAASRAINKAWMGHGRAHERSDYRVTRMFPGHLKEIDGWQNS